MIKLDLSLEEVNVVLAHLQKGSWEQVNGLIVKIREQGLAQLESKKEEEIKEDK